METESCMKPIRRHPIVFLLLALIVSAYAYSMIIHPIIESRGDWDNVLSVWREWQTLNAAFIALMSSLIAFYAALYADIRKRQRQRIAAISMLSESLSELCSYLESCATITAEAIEREKNDSDDCRSALSSPMPSRPSLYKESFPKIIMLANKRSGMHFARILSELQVSMTRTERLAYRFSSKRRASKQPEYLESTLLDIIELRARVNNSFDYSRFESREPDSEVKKEDMTNAALNLGINLDSSEYILNSIEGLDKS